MLITLGFYLTRHRVVLCVCVHLWKLGTAEELLMQNL